jgi:hypothetical protein
MILRRSSGIARRPLLFPADVVEEAAFALRTSVVTCLSPGMDYLRRRTRYQRAAVDHATRVCGVFTLLVRLDTNTIRRRKPSPHLSGDRSRPRPRCRRPSCLGRSAPRRPGIRRVTDREGPGHRGGARWHPRRVCAAGGAETPGPPLRPPGSATIRPAPRSASTSSRSRPSSRGQSVSAVIPRCEHPSRTNHSWPRWWNVCSCR